MGARVMAFVLLALAVFGAGQLAELLLVRLLGDKLQLTYEGAGKKQTVVLRGRAATVARRCVRALQAEAAVLRLELAAERGEEPEAAQDWPERGE